MRPETHGTQRYFAWLYSSPAVRDAFATLLELEREICAPARVVLEHQIAHARLEWWRAECARARSGAPVHPLMRSLVRAAARLPMPLDLSGLVEVATWDLARATFASQPELAGYCARWAAAITQPAAQLALPQAPPSRASEFGRALGVALKELELLSELDREAYAGRLRLPLDTLEHSGIEAGSLAHPPWGAALSGLLAERLRTLREGLERCVAMLSAPERASARGLVVWAELAMRQARRAQAALPQAWHPSGASRLADAWISWRAARRAS